jgi:hypothetical protein
VTGIEILLVGALLGWFGHSQIVEPTCTAGPLVEASCPPPVPPSDDSFGATTYSLTSTVGQYRECRAACLGGGK